MNIFSAQRITKRRKSFAGVFARNGVVPLNYHRAILDLHDVP